MSMKLKVLGLGLLAVMATSAFAVMNATAETGGHFTSDVHHTTIVGAEKEGHKLEFTVGSSAISCTSAEYHGTISATTVESVTVAPNWENCYTTPESSEFGIDENGCDFTFTIGREGQAAKHHTVHLTCPTGETIEITHANCTIHVPPQTLTGVTYNTVTEAGKHAITLESTVQNITTHYESGICIFLGTSQTGEMHGSATVWGEDTNGNRVNITATTGPKK